MSLIIIIIGLCTSFAVHQLRRDALQFTSLWITALAFVWFAQWNIDYRSRVEIKRRRRRRWNETNNKRGKHNVYTYRLLILNGHFVIELYTVCSCAISIAFITNFISSMPLCCDDLSVKVNTHHSKHPRFAITWEADERAGKQAIE